MSNAYGITHVPTFFLIEPVLKSASAIVQGLGITFKEMMKPTITEDYP